MLAVAGAVYFEQCNEGSWNELFGSGFRAAACLAAQTQVELHSYLSAGEIENAKLLAGLRKVSLISADRPDAISFRYQHGLSVPSIHPPIHRIKPSSPLRVHVNRTLRFGMLEGDAIVESEYAVYDPQSAYSPEPFGLNGSKAKHLSIVCNRHEASLLAGTTDLQQAVTKIMSTDNAEVIVVKSGSKGAYVYESGNQLQHVPPYRTETVWPIGSGDVFAAWYAFEWAVNGKQPLEAAHLASRATAQYCGSKSIDGLNPNDPEFAYEPLSDALERTLKYDVYLAGPFFDISQRWLIDETKMALEGMGLKVFSPFHDVGIGSPEEIYPADIAGLNQSHLVYAVLDGCDPGTIFELGYAASQGKPIVGFSQNETDEHLKMLKGSPTFSLHSDYVSSIYHAAWRSRTK